MANSTTGSVWKLDTAGVITTKAVTVMGFVYKPGANSDDLTVVDAKGDTVINWDASSDITTQPQFGLMFPKPKTFQGLTVSVIDGGNLYVYLA